MATQVQIRRGTSSQVAAFTGAEGEIVVNTTNDSVHVNDGSTAGGFEMARVDGSNWNVTNNTLVVDTTNNRVGVGVASPSVALQVSGQIKNNNGYLIDNGTNAGFLTVDGSNVNFGSSTAAKGLAFFTAASSQAMTIDSSGNVGIGTTSPSFAVGGGLQVQADSFSSVRVTETGNTGLDVSQASDAKGYVYLRDNADLIFGTNNTERMRIDAIGNVGIGETSPSTYGKLVVTGSTPFAVLRSSDVTTAGFSMLVNSGSNGVGSIATDNGGHMTFDTGSTGAGQAERMRIDSSGNVGIGTSSPVTLLNTKGATLTTTTDKREILIEAHGDGINNSQGALTGITFRNSPTTYTAGSFNRTSGVYGLNEDSAGYGRSMGLAFYTATNDATAAERMRIGSSGNVGIGTSSPASKLHVENGALEVNTASSAAAVVRINYNATDSIRRIHALETGGGNARPLQIHAQDVRFRDDSTERMRIDASGKLLLATTNTGGTFSVERNGNTYNINAVSDANNTSEGFFRGYSTGAGADRVIIYSNGNIVNAGNSYGALSDLKLKENIVDSGSQWDDLKAVRVRKYSIKLDQVAEANQLGVIAQELEESGMAGLVYESADRDIDGNDLGTTTKQVKYSILYMKAVKALQEAMDRIETLESKVQQLENN